MGWSSIKLVMGFEQYQLQCRFRQVSKTEGGGGLWGGGGGEAGYLDPFEKKIINERAWKLRAIHYAFLPSSSCMLLELMEMFFSIDWVHHCFAQTFQSV